MKYILSVISLILILAISGCGYKEGVATASQKSYIYFSGNTDDVKISIDNGEEFSIESGKLNQYSIKPGKHIVKVFRENTIVTKREIFVGDGISKEIEVQ